MKHIHAALCAAVCALALTGVTAAQDQYPSKPIRIIGPYGPGGATDIVARLVGEQLRRSMGQPIVVENKPGAFGILALEEMMHAKADGYTIMVGNNSTHAVTPIVFSKKLSFDFERDVQPITRLAEVPSFLLVTPKDFPPRSVQELIAYAKQNPGKLRYGTVGVGSYPHYDMALLAKRAGLDMVHIPNKAGASGVIVADLTPDEGAPFEAVAEKAGLAVVYLVAPTTPPERRAMIARRSRGFLYCVSLVGVTGARTSLPASVEQLVRDVIADAPLPVAVGFGVSKPAHVRGLAKAGADGVIVASALVDALGNDGRDVTRMRRLVSSLRDATQR